MCMISRALFLVDPCGVTTSRRSSCCTHSEKLLSSSGSLPGVKGRTPGGGSDPPKVLPSPSAVSLLSFHCPLQFLDFVSKRTDNLAHAAEKHGWQRSP